MIPMAGALSASELRRAAVDFAQLGAAEAMRWFGKVSASRKVDNTPVTAADHASQEAILYHVASRYPQHAILVEEEVARPQRHRAAEGVDYCWVVDPLDGTRNFARGIHVFAVSVAVLQQGAPVAGAIYDATADGIYSASTEEGAFFGDVPLRLVDQPTEAEATIAISSFRRRQIPAAVRGWMDHYLFRNFGSLALHLAWVASGRVEAAYALEAKLWDVAAGALLIEQAGGTISDHQGSPLWPFDIVNYSGDDVPILAGATPTHRALLSVLSGQAALQ
jgi:myo-inositol-1(or 4)-monophosphatase